MELVYYEVKQEFPSSTRLPPSIACLLAVLGFTFSLDSLEPSGPIAILIPIATAISIRGAHSNSRRYTSSYGEASFSELASCLECEPFESWFRCPIRSVP